MLDDPLPNGWKWAKLEDVQDPSGKAIVTGPFGSNIGSRFFVERGVPVIRGNNLTTDVSRFIDDGFVFVTEEKAEELAGCQALAGDLIFTAAGSLGQVGKIPQTAKYPKYIISNKQMRARVDRSQVEPLFAFYWFSSSRMVKYIEQRNTGSSVPLINLSILRGLPIPLPPLIEQRAILEVLDSLDRKIELNRRMNETLEAMTRAIFKSWFVDFDPVRAKAEGRPPFGMDAETAALFPDSFEDSPQGKIPKGWEVSKLGEVVELAYGKALREDARCFGNVPVYGSNGQVGWHDEALVKGPGIVVGRKGNPGFVTWTHTDFFPIDTTFYVVPRANAKSLHFFFHVLSLIDLPSLGADSAVPGLNRNIAYMSEILVPSVSALAAFDQTCNLLNKRVEANNNESRTLAAIRDTLLPKLISGEIQVKNGERKTAFL